MKTNPLRGLGSAIIIVLFTVWLNPLVAQNWPQFRGGNSNQIAEGMILPLEWDSVKNIQWKHKDEGKGWSCPIIWDDKVFYTSVVFVEWIEQAEDTAHHTKKDDPINALYRWEVICLNVETGEEIWKNVAFTGKPGISHHRDNNYAPETPVTDGQRVYAYFGMKGVYCCDLDGNKMWEKDLGVFEMKGNWGTSSSPVLFKDNLFIQVDNEESSFLVALDTQTGNENWKVNRDEKSNYGTPVIWDNEKRTELVVGGKKARSYDPITGKLIWELDMKGGRNISCPVANKKMLYMGNEKRRDGGGYLFAVKTGANGDISLQEGDSSNTSVAWVRENSGVSMSSPLLFQGYIYIVERRRGMIYCYEAATGKTMYRSIKIPGSGPFWASPWAGNGEVLCMDENGTTFAIKPGEKFEVLRQNKLNDRFWSTQAITDGTYIFRGVEYIYCIKEAQE